MASQENQLMVAAIDFGTTFSGYAFSMRDDLAKIPPIIYAANWHAANGGLISFKTPTTVLLDGSKKFVAFGFEAEEQYAELAEEGEHEDHYYFRRFKMLLYDRIRKSKLTMETKVSDIRNRELPAVDVFTHSIKYLKDHLLAALDKKGSIVKEDDITWVLTVPAIWDDPAKQFMRKAAQAAGISKDHLMIALEPEAASIYCKHLPVEKLEGGDQIGVFKEGSKYLVLDAGGGTIDITVHEVIKDEQLKELEKASGNDWGGTSVDNAFKTSLMDIVGESFIEGYCHKYTGDYIEMFRDFEIKKRKWSDPNDTNSRITLKIPATFIEESDKINGNIKEITKISKFKKCFNWGADKVRIDLPTFESFFEPACTGTVNHVKELLKSPKVRGTRIIIMVGGFSESPLLQDAVRMAFPSCRVIIPQEAGLAVLKGAVLFGYNPGVISSRIAKFTYGVDMCQTFDPTHHKQSKRIVIDDEEYCSDIFDRHVKQDQNLIVDEAQQERVYVPLRANQKAMDFKLFTATTENPKYIDDPNCTQIGKLSVEMPMVSGGLNRKVKVRFIFGGTELRVEGINVQTNKKTETEIDLLEIGENKPH